MKIRQLLFTGLPALMLAFFAGCRAADDANDEGLVPTSGTNTDVASLNAVTSTGTATISGTVTFDGDPPRMETVDGIEIHPHCMLGETHKQTWVVNPATKGVENVVVWVNPPKGQYFKKPEKVIWPEVVSVDQPFCAFIPHVVALFPQTYNGKEYEPTGQMLKVKNSAPIPHNIRIAGSPQENGAQGKSLSPTETKDFTLNLDPKEVSLNCDIHKWMTGYALTFDHPYAVVSDKDGKFEIKGVPAGVDVTIQAWHESSKKKFAPDLAGGSKVKLADGQNLNASFKIQPK